jgi:hypothetical protein
MITTVAKRSAVIKGMARAVSVRQFYNTGVVAVMLGVSRTTLMTWLRNHPELEPTRTVTDYRKWQDADIERVRAFMRGRGYREVA